MLSSVSPHKQNRRAENFAFGQNGHIYVLHVVAVNVACEDLPICDLFYCGSACRVFLIIIGDKRFQIVFDRRNTRRNLCADVLDFADIPVVPALDIRQSFCLLYTSDAADE